MSRIGKKPISIPAGITVSLQGQLITVKGSKGSLAVQIHPLIKVEIKENVITVINTSDTKLGKGLHGLSRTLIANAIHGLTKGFEKKLEINGIGYKGVVQGKKLTLNLGFSHPIEYHIPEGITIEFDKEKKNILTISGADKQLVGETAAIIRGMRKPEPYKGKGIKYLEERIIRKAGKTASAAKEA